MAVRLLLCLLLLTGCGGLAAPEPEGPLTGDRLVEALREGGLVLYLRHTETTEGGVDDVATLGDCTKQRELSDPGRQDAREIGAAFEELEIPVGRVVASPFCRTVETAELAFGETETDEALLALASTGQDESTQERAMKRGRSLIAAKPSDGTNVVLVGHISNVGPITGASPKEGGTVIFRPYGDGDFQLVAEVPPQGWQRLASQR
jgi:phosphohistidine phosphatase SixA